MKDKTVPGIRVMKGSRVSIALGEFGNDEVKLAQVTAEAMFMLRAKKGERSKRDRRAPSTSIRIPMARKKERTDALVPP